MSLKEKDLLVVGQSKLTCYHKHAGVLPLLSLRARFGRRGSLALLNVEELGFRFGTGLRVREAVAALDGPDALRILPNEACLLHRPMDGSRIGVLLCHLLELGFLSPQLVTLRLHRL